MLPLNLSLTLDVRTEPSQEEVGPGAKQGAKA